MNNQLKSLLLTILAILIMVAPAAAVHEIDKSTETHIIAVEGLYTDGTDINIGAVDQADILAMSNADELGADANNDSALITYNSGATPHEAYFGNYITYLGNGSYIITPDYTDNPETTFTYGQNLYIPLNLTTTEILNSDFLRLNYNSDQYYYIVFQNDLTDTIYKWYPTTTANDTKVFIPYLSVKSNLGDSTDSNVYLWIGGNQGNTALDGEPVSVEFKLELFELDAEHSTAIEDTSLYFLIVGIADIVLIVAFIFTTQWIDVKVDKSKK